MSDRLRNILDAAIAQRPNEFRQLMDTEIGERIVGKINSQYENTFIDADPEDEDEDEDFEDEDFEEEEEFEIDLDDEDLDDLSSELFDDEDVVEEAVEAKTRGNQTVELTKKQGVLSQTRDQGQRNFVAKHHVKKVDDANGNKDDVFNATNVPSVERQPMHGYNPGEDEAVYEETLIERALSPAEEKERSRIADSMMADPKVVANFKKRYGKEWKSVLMAVATKQAKK